MGKQASSHPEPARGASVRPRYEAVIVGAGPAGLSAALILGRCCRRVLLCDGGEGRNAGSAALHGFLTREGTPPGELRRIARAQLAPYTTVDVRDVVVSDAGRTSQGFLLRLATGETVHTGKLLLATGVLDVLPPIPGLAERWGRSVFPCPYCDAYEFRGRPLGVLGRAPAAVAQCRALTTWSDDLLLLLDGGPAIDPAEARALVARGVTIMATSVHALEGPGVALERIVLADGQALPCHALFLSEGQHQRSPLVERLGCPVGEGCAVRTLEHESTDIPGLYVAGDASDNLQLAIVAAAEGAEAGFAINRALVREALSAPASMARAPRVTQVGGHGT